LPVAKQFENRKYILRSFSGIKSLGNRSKKLVIILPIYAIKTEIM